MITFTKEGTKWVISDPDFPNDTIRHTNKNTAIDFFEKALHLYCVSYEDRNALLKDARKLGRGKLRRSKRS